MDALKDPFAPGAGTPPPDLVGRGPILQSALVALQRARDGRPSKSTILIGLRGVGKTVLLDRICQGAQDAGLHAIRLEAP